MAYEENPPLYISITGQTKTGRSSALALIKSMLENLGADVSLADDQTTRDNMDIAMTDTSAFEAQKRLQGRRIILRVTQLTRE